MCLLWDFIGLVDYISCICIFTSVLFSLSFSHVSGYMDNQQCILICGITCVFSGLSWQLWPHFIVPATKLFTKQDTADRPECHPGISQETYQDPHIQKCWGLCKGKCANSSVAYSIGTWLKCLYMYVRYCMCGILDIYKHIKVSCWCLFEAVSEILARWSRSL